MLLAVHKFYMLSLFVLNSRFFSIDDKIPKEVPEKTTSPKNYQSYGIIQFKKANCVPPHQFSLEKVFVVFFYQIHIASVRNSMKMVRTVINIILVMMKSRRSKIDSWESPNSMDCIST